MKILLTGGGTGGHITPILAVAAELKRLEPKSQIIYVGERGGKFSDLIDDSSVIDQILTVYSGKFRRYNGQSWISRLFDFRTNLLNLRDLFYFSIGTIQSLFLIKQINPDVVFLKGGYVGVPVGLSAAFWNTPLVTHDSDAVPGLANRLVSRWVDCHATGLPLPNYKYPKQKMEFVGVLVDKSYQKVDSSTQVKLKEQINIDANSKLLLVTGGSLGAKRLNDSIYSIVDELLQKYPSLTIIHQVGKGKAGLYKGFHNSRLVVLEFLKPMYVYTGAADLVVTRAGANTLAELGIQRKACIVVPNPELTGGHQLKNADYIQANDAAVIVQESSMIKSSNSLKKAITELLDDGARRQVLAEHLGVLTKDNAASNLAKILINQAQKEKK